MRLTAKELKVCFVIAIFALVLRFNAGRLFPCQELELEVYQTNLNDY
jgi:hypothetical protein